MFSNCKKLAATLIVFSVGSPTVYAQSEKIDCDTLSDKSISIRDDNTNATVTGQCEEITIDADEAQVRISATNALKVRSDNAQITVGAVGEVWMPGDNNFILIESVSGKFDLVGDNNKVGLGTINRASIRGDSNELSIEKAELDLDVAGDNNFIELVSVPKINARGDNNAIYYSGAEPKFSARGNDNNLIAGRRQSGGGGSESAAPKQAAAPKPATTTASSADPSGVLPAGLENMWFIYSPNSGNTWAAMTFNNGRLTSDVKTVLREGVAASQRAHPGLWATYSKSSDGEQLFVKFPNWPKTGKYYTNDKSIKMGNDFKLTGCFQSSTSSNSGLIGGVGSSTFSSSEFCFDKNGRFSNDSSFAIGGTGGGRSLGTSQAGKHGTYRISGHSLVLNYANGQTLKSAFGAYLFGEKTISAISIGPKIYH